MRFILGGRAQSTTVIFKRQAMIKDLDNIDIAIHKYTKCISCKNNNIVKFGIGIT